MPTYPRTLPVAATRRRKQIKRFLVSDLTTDPRSDMQNDPKGRNPRNPRNPRNGGWQNKKRPLRLFVSA